MCPSVRLACQAYECDSMDASSNRRQCGADNGVCSAWEHSVPWQMVLAFCGQTIIGQRWPRLGYTGTAAAAVAACVPGDRGKSISE